jgi:ribonuclease HI/pterin-4a-carbinolamine dehydratase
MWQKTKHGLYKQFNFINFKEAFEFITQVARLAEEQKHYPRWENEWNVVNIWLSTHQEITTITEQDRSMAEAIDTLIKEGEPVSEWSKNEKKQQYKIKMYADGGSRGNPGPSASGYVLLDLDDKILVDEGIYLGITTNNQAEYTALKVGLEAAKAMGVLEIDVYMDSLLVINQMKGIFKVKNRDLWPIHSAIVELARQFKKVTFTHVPRELNKLADAAVNRALDKALGIKT